LAIVRYKHEPELAIILLIISGRETLENYLDHLGLQNWRNDIQLNLLSTISNFLVTDDEDEWAQHHLKLLFY